MNRCPWVPNNDPEYIEYHDKVWGVVDHDSKRLFAKLMLDIFQAGLSWRTILHKWDNFMLAFDNFNPELVSKYDQEKIAELMQNAGIVRNRMKVEAMINNSQRYLDMEAKGVDFGQYLWSFVNGETITHTIRSLEDYPSTSLESDAMAKDLKQQGFKFVGSTICYAFMQGCGMYNDHSIDCFRYNQV